MSEKVIIKNDWRKNMSAEGFNYDNMFVRLLNRLGDAMILSILFVVCSLPIFTIGASVTALYYAAMKGVKGGDGYVAKYFMKSFKDNFKQSTIIWLICLVAFFILGVDVWYWFEQRQAGGGMMIWAMQIISVIMLSVAVMVAIYVFPLQAKFDNTIKVQFRNAFLLSIKYFPTTLLIALSMAIIVWCFYYAILVSIVGYVLVGFGLVGYIFAFFMLRCFKPYLPEEEADSGDDWSLDMEESESAQVEDVEEEKEVSEENEDIVE